MTRFSSTGLLALTLTTVVFSQPGKDALKTVTYTELGQQIRGLKGKVVVVYFWADY